MDGRCSLDNLMQMSPLGFSIDFEFNQNKTTSVI